MKPLEIFFAIAIAIAATEVNAQEVIKVGSGGYRTTAPRLCKPLPAEIFKTSDMTGPMVTNQWWSSLAWQPYSQNMFAHPAFTRCDADGLVMGYQGARIHGNDQGIFGSADLVKGDFKMSHSRVEEFSAARCGGYSDWFVTAVFQEGDASLQTSFGHGSPFVYGLIENGEPRITFTSTVKIWSGAKDQPTLGVTVNGNHYGLFGCTGSSWDVQDETQFTNADRIHSHFSVAILPDNRPETLRLFERYAHAHVTNTRVEYSVTDGHAHATYQFVCTPREGTETGTVFALYPHQWKYATTHLGTVTDDTSTTDPLTYHSVRGLMKVGVGDGFSTSVPVQGVLPMLPGEGIADRDQMIAQLRLEAAKPKPEFKDTYWEGKHLGSLASCSGIAEVTSAGELQAEFVGEIQRRLEEWFTATADKEQPVFYYEPNWGTLIGSRPSYQSDEKLNDHHFHYGYFIRAAAEVARLDPAWAKAWGPMVRMLIRDIASSDRGDTLFPFLRCFDKYAGHSWASGDANFADGNNQESSSESLNAWYGVMLWGAATGDTELQDLGTFLFNTERTAVEEYWFDVSGTNYPNDFPEEALGMVWGGKGAFATWFSSDIDCIHGINWLPFTPASIYMGRHPDYVRKNYDQIMLKREHGNDYNSGWGDLVLMFGALNDPQPAINHLKEHSTCKIEPGNTRAFMEHWVGTLDKLGRIDPTTTTAHPFANVFVRDDGNDKKKTYTAYNFHSQPISVTFSDGVSLSVAAESLAVKSIPSATARP